MKAFEKIKKWWKENQEKNSDRYLERITLKKDLEEDSKDIQTILTSPSLSFNKETLESATLIQNLRLQKKLVEATDGLKTATWILALATALFAWVAIKDSPSSNEIIQNIQVGAYLIIYVFVYILGISIVWKIVKFVYSLTKKLLDKKRKAIE